MNNEVFLSSKSGDITIRGTLVAIALRTQAPFVGKLLLAPGGLFFLTPVAVLFSLSEQGSMVLPIVVFMAFWSLTIGRMILWNLFGEERITVTTEYVEFCRSYGIVQTGMHRHLLETPLIISTIHQRKTSGGRMEFSTINKLGRKVIILKTGVHLPQEHIDRIMAAIQAPYTLAVG